ncbi:hypothetical protein FA13DRAFT_905146 [Coprinellus micaceus]|uniref:Uncharacterized protein n=1 Tax=Coprinellus micaceus TaxID=71717 RepID=A0A4Y7TU64_COPMI|nr:hypothetical protein FA13DRAFT_905146 [Coprinellus micaceus]
MRVWRPMSLRSREGPCYHRLSYPKLLEGNPSPHTENNSPQLDFTNQDFFRPLPKLPQRSLSVTELQDVLSSYIHDNYEFAMTADVYKFWVPFQSAHRSNRRWSGEDGQILLDTIATGNGIRLWGDILAWTHVAHIPGTALFGYPSNEGTTPFLHYRVDALYTIVLENIDQFASHLENFVDESLNVGSFSPPIAKHDPQRLSGYELFFALATILFECLSRFNSAAITFPRLGSLVRSLSRWFEIWANRTTIVEPTFDDIKIAICSPQTRDAIVAHLRATVTVLNSLTAGGGPP